MILLLAITKSEANGKNNDCVCCRLFLFSRLNAQTDSIPPTSDDTAAVMIDTLIVDTIPVSYRATDIRAKTARLQT
jgi:hypothetical protein